MLVVEASVDIVQLETLPPSFAVLAAEAAAEGHRFLGRMHRAWLSGHNRFDQPGELSAPAARFYERLGFERVAQDTATHRWVPL